MKAVVKLMDNMNLEIDESDDLKTLLKALVFANPRRKCDVCGAFVKPRVKGNKDSEGNIYVNNYCECGARSKLGSYKDKTGFFWRDFELYVPTK